METKQKSLIEVLRKVSGVKDLKEIREKVKDDMRRVQVLRELAQEVRDRQVFLQVVERYEKVYQDELNLKRAKEFEVLYVTLPEIEGKVQVDEFEAFEILARVQSQVFMVDSVRTAVKDLLRSLKVKISEKLARTLTRLLDLAKFPFASKGQIIALTGENEARLSKAFRYLIESSSVSQVCELLSPSLQLSISSHFLTDSETNSIEKPEWMLNYSKSLINLNIIHLFDKFSIPQSQTDQALALIVPALNDVLFRRLESDIKIAISSNLESLFLHIIDSILNYDKFLYEIMSQSFLISRFLNEKFIEVWAGYEKVYIAAEIQKILNEESWNSDKITGNKYKNLEEICLLHQSLGIKYSSINDADIRNRLLNMMNELIISLFIVETEKKFITIRAGFFFYESNPMYWKEMIQETAAIHQTMVLFQMFMLKVDCNQFGEHHLAVNQLKKGVMERMLKLVGDSVDDLVRDYLGNVSANSRGINQKSLKNILNNLAEVSSKELAKEVLLFTLQNYSITWAEKIIKTKKLRTEHKESLVINFKRLFELFNDSGDLLELFFKKAGIS